MNRAFVLLVMLCLPSCAWAQSTAVQTASENHFGTPCGYPQSALAAHDEGTVFVSYRGTDNGHIVDVAITQSSGHADLDDATVQCVRNWEFDPKAAADQPDIGPHRAGIAWDIASSPGVRSVGMFIGLPHSCLWAYPKAEETAGIEGTTRVRFTIGTDGAVHDPVVDQTSGNSNLDDAAVRCVRHWHYRPAVKDGKPIVTADWKANVEWKVETPQPPPFAEPPRNCLRYYPVKADLANIDGTTEVTFNIVRGEVHGAQVTHSSGNTALDLAAVDCVSSRRYVRDTVTVNGVAVDKYSSMTLRERITWRDANKPGQ